MDTFGTGTDGACTVSSDTNINTGTCVSRANGDAVNFSVTANTTAGSGSITLSSTPTGLAADDEILIINLQGTSGSYSDVGEYEFVTISSINSNTLTLEDNLTNGYDGTTQKIMVQRVPQYTSVTVNASQNFFPSDWDGTKGGVIMFRATGSVTVTGSIHADSTGYMGGDASAGYSDISGAGESFCGDSGGTGGGAIIGDSDGDDGICGGGGGGGIYSSLTTGIGGTGSATLGGGGGGGGNSYSSGGTYGRAGGAGGGGYGTFGYGGTGYHGVASNGGTNSSGDGEDAIYGPSIHPMSGGGGGGGTYGDGAITNILLGSGGGGGGTHPTDGAGVAGGNGGGIVFISATTLTIGDSGVISCDGEDGGNGGTYSGGGGGGAGGSIKIYGDAVSLGTGKVYTLGGTGGTGSEFTPGGDGGNGRVRVEYISSLTGTSSPSASTNQFTLGYEDTAVIQSKDIISISDIFPMSFVYNLSSKPASTTATVQFSTDSSSWYNSSGSLGGTDSLTTGSNNEIDLSGLSWNTSDFYYKVSITTNSGADTPVLDDIKLNYETKPSAPTIGSATALSNSSIRWNFTDNADNETGFKLYNSSGSLIDTEATSDLGYIDQVGLTSNTQYSGKVLAYNGVGNSSYSSLATKYTLAKVPLLTCVDSDTDSAELSINIYDNPSVTHLALYESTGNKYVNSDSGALQSIVSWGTYSDFVSGGVTIITGLDDDTSYSFKAKARNEDGVETSFSSPVICTTEEEEVVYISPVVTVEEEEEGETEVDVFVETPLLTEEEVIEVLEIVESSEEFESVDEDDELEIVVGDSEVDVRGEGIHVFEDEDLEITIPVATLESNNPDASVERVYIVIDNDVYKLTLHSSGQYYEGTVSLGDSVGNEEVHVLTIYDDNSSHGMVLGVSIDPYGYIYEEVDGNQLRLSGATVTLYKVINRVVELYEGDSVENPQTTNSEGEYSFFVEPGMYQLKVDLRGYKEYTSDEFEVEQNTLNMNIKMTKIKSLLDYWYYFVIALSGGAVLLLLLRKK